LCNLRSFLVDFQQVARTIIDESLADKIRQVCLPNDCLPAKLVKEKCLQEKETTMNKHETHNLLSPTGREATEEAGQKKATSSRQVTKNYKERATTKGLVNIMCQSLGLRM
jgi:hypothetical protein